eukprot:m51a1_g12216 hypothetical protein (260) ;mRNA; f:20372-21463
MRTPLAVALFVAASLAAPRTAFLVIDVQNDFVAGGSLAVPHADEVVPAINRIRAQHAGAFDLVVLSQDWHSPRHSSFASTWGRSPYQEIELLYTGEGDLCRQPGAVPQATYFVDCAPTARTTAVRQVLWPDHCVAGSRGADFHAGLRRLPTDLVVRKGHDPRVDSYSAFYSVGRMVATELPGLLAKAGVGRVVVAGIARDYCAFYTAMDARSLGLDVVFVLDATRAVAEATGDAAVAAMEGAGVMVVNEADLPSVLYDN